MSHHHHPKRTPWVRLLKTVIAAILTGGIAGGAHVLYHRQEQIIHNQAVFQQAQDLIVKDLSLIVDNEKMLAKNQGALKSHLHSLSKRLHAVEHRAYKIIKKGLTKDQVQKMIDKANVDD